MTYEKEGSPILPQKDTIWITDGRGEFVKVTVDDDVSDD